MKLFGKKVVSSAALAALALVGSLFAVAQGTPVCGDSNNPADPGNGVCTCEGSTADICTNSSVE